MSRASATPLGLARSFELAAHQEAQYVKLLEH